MSLVAITEEVFCKAQELHAATHHLAGRVLGQTAHHAVHLVKLLLRGLHLSVELLVLGVLVVKHSSVLVSLLVGSDRWVFTGDERKRGKKTLG